MTAKLLDTTPKCAVHARG